jgi:hypothetical protein
MTVTGSRALGAVMLVSGLLVAMFALCCAVDSDHHDLRLAGATEVVHVDAGHDVDDCDHSFTVVSAPSTGVPAPVPAPVVLIAAVDSPAAVGPVVPTSVADRSPPLGPVPHLLCVLRT